MARAVVRGRYRGSRASGEGGKPHPGLVVGALALALAAGGCSLSFPVASLVPEEPVATASVAPRAISPLSPDLGTEDWRRARAAMAVALDPQGNGSAVGWDNPETLMRGTFTAAGAPYVRGDEICRAFSATLTGQDGGVSRKSGTACRLSGQEWLVQEVKPVRRPG